MPKIADPMSLLVSSQAVEHEIRVNESDEDVVMKVWVKELSFMQLQDAIKTFVTISGTVAWTLTSRITGATCSQTALKRLNHD